MQNETPTNEYLLVRQRELEEEGLALGVKRFQDRLEAAKKNGSVADQGAAKKLLEVGLEKFSRDLTQVVTEANAKRGAKSVALKWIELIGADKAAYIALRTCFTAGHGNETLLTVSRHLAKRIEDELRFRRLEAEAPELFNYRLSKFATSHYMHRSHSLDQAIRYTQGPEARARGYSPVYTDDLEIPQHEAVVLGTYLIDNAITSTGFFEVVTERVRGKTQKRLVLAGDTVEWLAARNDVLKVLTPFHPCMVVQPLPWGPRQLGGYRFALRGSNKLVRGARKAHLARLDELEMPYVYKALNLIQNTEWRINKRVLEVLKAVLENGGGVAGIPSTEPLPVPPKPPDIDTNEEARRKWRRREHNRRQEDIKRGLECLKVVRLRNQAEEYANEERIYFPHSLDFRGRIYPIPTGLSPQGDDVQKALLTFATAKPLGPDGVRYLAIHGANAWGKTRFGQKVSKMTLDERVAYIEGENETIQRIAQNPIECTLWMDADEPWVFLAFCFEWADMLAYGDREAFPSSLPVASDGACNGLQHYAALLRDPVAAKAVNVLDNNRPSDIYQEVADVVLQRLEREAADEPMARKWLDSGLVNRSLTKRPTMTLAYGAKQFGFKDQLIDYLTKDVPVSKLEPFEAIDESTGEIHHDLHGPCVYMAKLIWESLGGVVVSAQEGMALFQKYARTMAKVNQNPTWIVPGTGFMVYQNSYKQERRQVKTVLCGQAYFPAVYKDSRKVDPVGAANGVAPNVIHSMDAAALMLTVIRAADVGITSFAMIHDSYGTHAADAAVLNHELRQAFFSLYKGNPLEDLASQFNGQIEAANKELAEKAAAEGKKRPKLLEPLEVPERGNLDLSRVLVSDYFFC